tara:strand:- start:138 stop:515 length:378 start_codon:yes stop_codon:yes gene_type:complete
MFKYISGIYIFITVVLGASTYWSISFGGMALAILCPLFMWGSGSGMRGSLYAELGAKIIGSILGLSFAALFCYLLFNSGYQIMFFQTLIISGYAWGIIGFILGFITTNKKSLSPQYRSESLDKNE